MLRFKNMPKVREKAIQAASPAPLPKTLTTNEKAKQRHPEKQGRSSWPRYAGTMPIPRGDRPQD